MTEKTLEALTDEEWEMIKTIRENREDDGFRLLIERKHGIWNSKNSKANRIKTMKDPAEFGQICSGGRRKIAKKIAKNKRCYANTLRPRSRMLLKVMKGG